DLLSAPIKEVNRKDWILVGAPTGRFVMPRWNSFPSDLSVYAQLMCKSTIGNFNAGAMNVVDTTVSSIINIASRSKEFTLEFDRDSLLADPAAFITELSSAVSPFVRLTDHYSIDFLGLPLSFWQNFLNEKLANGSFEYVMIYLYGNGPRFMEKDAKMFTEPLIDIPVGSELYSIEWDKKV
ncbi:hypothetical protein PMAYCL1PPCAC_27438, partial [Pristionchus mayeri]